MNHFNCGHRIRTGIFALMAIGSGTGLIGCSQPTEGTPCASVTVTRISDDANNTESLTPFDASQCDAAIGDGTLSIDLLNRDATGDRVPRVLLTLRVSGDTIPFNGEFDLSRGDDGEIGGPLPVPPALYQEYTGNIPPDFELADGPFWSSAQTSAGTLTLSVNDSNQVVGTFEFDADNPVTLNNDARGMVHVRGTVLVQELKEEEVCGIFGAPAMIMMLLSLNFLRIQVRRKTR